MTNDMRRESNARYGQHYTGKYFYDYFPFQSLDLWIECQRDLVAADALMKIFAEKYRMRFAANNTTSEGPWP